MRSTLTVKMGGDYQGGNIAQWCFKHSPGNREDVCSDPVTVGNRKWTSGGLPQKVPQWFNMLITALSKI